MTRAFAANLRDVHTVPIVQIVGAGIHRWKAFILSKEEVGGHDTTDHIIDTVLGNRSIVELDSDISAEERGVILTRIVRTHVCLTSRAGAKSRRSRIRWLKAVCSLEIRAALPRS